MAGRGGRVSSGVVDEGARSTHSARHRTVGAGLGGRAGTCRRGRNTGARWRREPHERVTDMNARVSGELREYHAWLDGVEPAWTVLEPARWEALMREPSAEKGAIRLASDLTNAELKRSAIVRNALVLLRAAARGAGLELTARGYLTRAKVAALREAMDWPGCAFEERRRVGKLLGEAQIGELRVVRALLEEAGCVQSARSRFRSGWRSQRRGERLAPRLHCAAACGVTSRERREGRGLGRIRRSERTCTGAKCHHLMGGTVREERAPGRADVAGDGPKRLVPCETREGEREDEDVRHRWPHRG